MNSIPPNPQAEPIDLRPVVDAIDTAQTEATRYANREGDHLEHGHKALIALDQATGELYRLRGLLAERILDETGGRQ